MIPDSGAQVNPEHLARAHFPRAARQAARHGAKHARGRTPTDSPPRAGAARRDGAPLGAYWISILRARVSGRFFTETYSTPFSTFAATVDGSAVSGRSTLTA